MKGKKTINYDNKFFKKKNFKLNYEIDQVYKN